MTINFGFSRTCRAVVSILQAHVTDLTKKLISCAFGTKEFVASSINLNFTQQIH